MPLVPSISRHLLAPRRNLGAFVQSQAKLASANHGFTFVPSSNAPATYSALLKAYDRSKATARPYPISSAHSEDTIFTDPEINWAMRFMHDLEHAKRELTFSVEDELILGGYHLEALNAAGYGPDSFEYKLLEADTIGQTHCLTTVGRHPLNQRLFAYDCIDLGIDRAIELEATYNPAA